MWDWLPNKTTLSEEVGSQGKVVVVDSHGEKIGNRKRYPSGNIEYIQADTSQRM